MTAILTTDQSASFDLIDHTLLKARMKMIGFDEDSLRWITSYLSNRTQVVEIQGFQSPQRLHPPCSIIQGSVATSILFNIFTMDIPHVIHPDCSHTSIQEESSCKSGMVTVFVDDNSMAVTGKTPTEVQTMAQTSMDTLSSHMTANLLKLNRDKTNLTLVAKPAHQREGISIKAENKIVKSQESVKLLGAHIHQTLKWKTEIVNLSSQLQNRLQSIRQISKYSSSKILKQIAPATILGKIFYAIQLHGTLPDYLAHRIQTTIIQAAKITLGPGSWKLSTSSILKKLGWMSYRQYEHYFSTSLALQSVNTGTPEYISSMFPPPGIQTTRSQQAGSLRLPPWNKSISRDSYRYWCINYLNTLPPNIRAMQPGPKQNKLLKEHTLSTISPYIRNKTISTGWCYVFECFFSLRQNSFFYYVVNIL